MLIALVIFNLLLASLCFYIAWHMWLWRRALAQAADALLEADRVTHELLDEAPSSIAQGQFQTRRLRQSYRQLSDHVHQLRYFVGLFNLFYPFMHGKVPLRPLVRRIRSSV